MAEFNPALNIGQPDNFTGRSQGVPDPGGVFETLFRGLGQAVGGVAQTIDVKNQTDIRKQVEGVQEATNLAYGLDEETAWGTVPGLSPEAVPPELKGARQQWEKMLAARQKGALSEAHYWGLMMKAQKDIRAKYPGYSEIIDNIFADVTGAKPANALRAAMNEEYNTEINRANAASNEVGNRIWTMREEVATLYPDYFSNAEKYAGREEEVINAAVNLKAQREGIAARTAELTLLRGEDELNEEEAAENFTKRSQMIVNNAVTGALNSLGFNPKTFVEDVQRMQKEGVKPEVLNQLRSQIATLKVRVGEEFTKMRSEEWAMSITPERIKTMQEAAIAQLDGYEKMITDENLGMMYWHAGINKVVGDRAMTDAYKMIPELLDIQTMEKVSPALANWLIMTHQGGKAIIDKLVPGALMKTILGKTSVAEVVETFDKEVKANPKDKEAALTSFFVTLEQSFARPEMSDQSVLDFVNANFMGDSPEINKVWNSIDSESWDDLYNKLASPAIVDRIAKTGDKIAIGAYAAWLVDQWDNLPETRTAIGNLANSSQAKNGDVTTVYDAGSKRLVAVPSSTGDTKVTDETANAILNNMVRKQQVRLDKVNANLGNLVYALEKSGQNPDKVIQQIFATNGITVETGEGTSDGTNPLELDETGGLLLDESGNQLAQATPPMLQDNPFEQYEDQGDGEFSIQLMSYAEEAQGPLTGNKTEEFLTLNDPVQIAEKFNGLNEVEHRDAIAAFIKKSAGQNIDPATTAWCAAFANAVIGAAGGEGTGKLNARSFLNWGKEVETPTKGDIVVFSRGRSSWKGHVGFYLGTEEKDGKTYIRVLGGNQSNKVQESLYPASKVLGYRRATKQTSV